MSRQYLEMKYHPAKKEVRFRRFENNKEVVMKEESVLEAYMSERGKFILQDKGDKFFDDIAEAFDGEGSVTIDVVTTIEDYGDFENMVKYYNKSKDRKCEIKIFLKNELPSMKDMFEDVKTLGEDVMDIIDVHKAKMHDLDLTDVNTKDAVEGFMRVLDKEKENIQEKLDSLSDNNINICLAGVYSSGKSTLINNLLGCKVLPEDIESKTAKMFKIVSPKEGKPVSVVFNICGEEAKIEWSEINGSFIFASGAVETKTRKEIQDCINNIKYIDDSEEGLNLQHIQLYSILEVLNKQDSVSTIIELNYPIELDNENLKFTIYDTPGSDSNVEAHKDTLIEALSEQTHSILIFIMTPDRMEGEGNNVLLQILDDAEKNQNTTSIDVSRSLFVINKADSTDEKSLRILANKNLEDKGKTISIPLKDKKLFFTVANMGRTAKMIGKGIANEAEKKEFKKNKNAYTDEDFIEDFPYRFNHYGNSEFSTSKSIEKCDNEFKKHIENENETKAVEVATGIFALENEIITYGEKFAMAVKTYAIIDSINKILNTLDNKVALLEKETDLKLEQIDKDIKILGESLKKSVDDIRNKYVVKENKLDVSDINALGLSSTNLYNNLNTPVKKYIEDSLKTKLWSNNVKESEFNYKQNDIEKYLELQIDAFHSHFIIDGKEYLVNKRESFITEIKENALKNGDLSQEARDFIQNLQTPAFDINMPSKNINGNDWLNWNKKVKWFGEDVINKYNYIKYVDEEVTSIASELADSCKVSYSKCISDVVTKIDYDVKNNLANYSAEMKAMITNKVVMQQFKNEIIDTGSELKSEYKKLNTTIWRDEEK